MPGVKLLPLIPSSFDFEFEILLDGASRYRLSDGSDPLLLETPYRYEITHSDNDNNRMVNIWPSIPIQPRADTSLVVITLNCNVGGEAIRELKRTLAPNLEFDYDNPPLQGLSLSFVIVICH